MTYLEFLRLIRAVVTAGECCCCGGAQKIGADNRKCGACEGTGKSATGR